jgi:3-oxoacyl-[acyl-carrier protein] reductase
MLVGRSAARLDALISALRSAQPDGGRLIPLAVDLAAPDAVATIVAAVEAAGGVDVLVNNAAVQGPIGPLWENDWAEWVACLQMDLLVPVALCRALKPWLGRGRRGKVINLSGGGATGPRANFTAYAVAKTGLVRFTESFAHEVRDHNIDVNAVAPGIMASAMTKAVLAAGEKSGGEAELAVARKVLAGDNAATPHKAAGLCAWLASSASDGITGRLLAALWDPWADLQQFAAELRDSDIYTLRRIVPADRGKDWESQ